jgi:G3E family GTPase
MGTGKTTLLKHILVNRKQFKVSITVNNMSEINKDTGLVREGGFSRTKEKVVELQNGCMGYILREDLIIEVKRLVDEDNIITLSSILPTLA